jgi:hypothetical protein
MTVVAVSHGYPPFWNMGGEVALHRAMTAVKGSRVVLTKTEEEYTFEDVLVKKINTKDVLNIYADPEPIAQQLKALKTRVVIGQNELSLPCVLAAKSVGAISIVNVHTPPRYGKGIREAVIHADFAVYNTRTSAVQWGEPNAVVLHPPITALPKEIKNKGDAYTLLSSLVNKGVVVVLALAKMYPDKRFIIVRSPAEPTHGLADIEQRVALLPNVELHPRVPPEEVYKYFEQTRILLAPSRYETYGMSAIEAAGYGIPSIHVDTPHVREGIGEAAVLIKPLSIDEAARGIDLIENDYEGYSARARERAEWLQDRQEVELKQFSDFVSTITKPENISVRQRVVSRASRINR